MAKKLKSDERICPFCAETIKAAAIRCRYCQSDLTPVPAEDVEPEPEAADVEVPAVEPEPEPEPEPVPELKPEPTAVEEPTDQPAEVAPSRQTVLSFVQQRLTLVLAALVVLAALGVGVSWWRAEQASSSATAPNGALVSDEARTEVLVTAADLTKRTLSYDYRTLENDMEVARARMTPGFRKEYDNTMKQVRANTEKNKIVLQAVPVSTAIISATERRATVLVFLNQTTTAGSDKKQQLDRNSLVITLTRGEGDWAMSKLTALG